MAQGSADPRKYDSRLRKAQMERTAEQIVDAAAQVIAESGVTELSMARVAARAGVALRTLYRHFGTRDELLHAIGEHFERDLKGSGPPMPQTPDEFIAAMPVLFEFFEANAEAVEAMHATQTARQLRQIARGRRTERAREGSPNCLCDPALDVFFGDMARLAQGDVPGRGGGSGRDPLDGRDVRARDGAPKTPDHQSWKTKLNGKR
jgi:AcrR family transcriptional regulator